LRFIAIAADPIDSSPQNPALTDRVLLAQPVRLRPSVYELKPFFAITSFSISRSRLRSATQFLQSTVLILQLRQTLRLARLEPAILGQDWQTYLCPAKPFVD
jgi:hypothetical protein